MTMYMTGDWARARRMLDRGARGLDEGIRKALAQEAEGVRKAIIRGLTEQAPGGKAIRKPAVATLAARRLKGFHGTKSLIVRADLRNAVCTVLKGDAAFVGVRRTAKGKDGRALVDVARVQEFGSGPRTVVLTDAMRRFLGVLRREQGMPKTSGSGKSVVVIRTPARPFIRPAAEAALKGIRERFPRRLVRILGWQGK